MNIKKAAKNILKNPIMIFSYLGNNGRLKWIPDKLYLKAIYYAKFKEPLNFKNPVSCNEKLNWLKIYDRKPIYHMMSDKCAARDFVKERIGEHVLVPIHGVYDSFDDIDFDMLPDKFILKCSHDSGSSMICKDKSTFDIEKARKHFKHYLKRDYYYEKREWSYKGLVPKLICEMFLQDKSGGELMEYKIVCFNGKAKFLHMCLNRYTQEGMNVDYYDCDWNPVDIIWGAPRSNKIMPRPVTLEKMLSYAEILAKDTPFLRVDFYEVDGKNYFGEMTFYPCGGLGDFDDKNVALMFGNEIDITEIKALRL